MSDYFGLKIGLDGDKEFKQNLKDIVQSLKGLGTELTLCTSQFDKQDKSTQSLTAQNEALVKAIETQKDLIASLEKGLERAAAQYGENDTHTKSWAIQLNLAKTTLNEMERELSKNNAALGEGIEQYDKNLNAVKEYTDRNKDLGKQFDEQQSKVEAMQKHLQRASDILTTLRAVSTNGSLSRIPLTPPTVSTLTLFRQWTQMAATQRPM